MQCNLVWDRRGKSWKKDLGWVVCSTFCPALLELAGPLSRQHVSVFLLLGRTLRAGWLGPSTSQATGNSEHLLPRAWLPALRAAVPKPLRCWKVFINMCWIKSKSDYKSRKKGLTRLYRLSLVKTRACKSLWKSTVRLSSSGHSWHNKFVPVHLNGRLLIWNQLELFSNVVNDWQASCSPLTKTKIKA